MNTLQWKLKSEIGEIFLVASAKGLRGVFWQKQATPFAPTLELPDPTLKILRSAVHQISRYFEGRLKKFTLPLDLHGTPFQLKVWEQLLNIPYGKTISYRELARNIQNEGAARAVGSANGRNPLCVIVPCHRVIASDGSLGGYSGGLEIKNRLIALEARGKP